jgi:glyoxylase-like metal-dependent hydrolase (beta-lactamase superfamily II)
LVTAPSSSSRLPGHTPGHRVLLLKLKKFGPLLIAGDLYHYPEEKRR